MTDILRFALPLTLAACLLPPLSASAQETALDGLRSAASAAPRDYDAQRSLGEGLLRAGRHREAVRVFERAERLARGNLRARYDVARVHFARREYHDARQACRRLNVIERDSVLFHVCMGRAFIAWNRASRAFDSIQTALGRAPNDYDALLALGDAHRLRASVDDAESAYRRAISARDAAAPHLGLGRLYLNAQRRNDAITELRRAVALDGTDPESQFELGRALGGAAGVPFLRQAVADRPTWGLAHQELGVALLDAGQAEAAIASFRGALERSPELPVAQAGLGRAQAALGHLDEAEATLRAALEQVPNNAPATLALADIRAQRGDTVETYSLYERAADLDPVSPVPLTRGARFGIDHGRPGYAMGLLQRVLQRHPSHAPALAMMGDIISRRHGQQAQAREFYQRALNGQGDIDRARVQAAMNALP